MLTGWIEGVIVLKGVFRDVLIENAGKRVLRGCRNSLWIIRCVERMC